MEWNGGKDTDIKSKKYKHKDDDDDSDDGDHKSRPFTATDVQKIRLEKLFSNIDKPIEIPKRREEKKFANAPEFVRNIMGSSAGAGSGEFHVYRHLRRKEYARQHFIETQARNEELDQQYQKRVEENRKRAEESTSKKRAKRLKKKEKLKAKKMKVDSSDNADNKSDNETDQKQSAIDDNKKSTNDESDSETEEK